MSAVLSLDAAWSVANQQALPKELAPWLLEPGSLTAQLKARSTSFRLQLLHEVACELPAFLQSCFANAPALCRRREVIMWANQHPAVYAQSWLPQQSIEQIAQLVDLGEQPLGELLFQFADVRRSPIEVARVTVPHSTHTIAAGDYWARRSVFFVAEQPLLVAEVFLPGVFAL